MRPHPALHVVAAAIAAALVLPGCREPEPGLGHEEGRVAVTALARGAPIARVRVEVSARDLQPPLVFELPARDGSASALLRIRPGHGRLFAVRAYGPDGELTHEGLAGIRVERGLNLPLSIRLAPVRRDPVAAGAAAAVHRW